jgi:cysteine synthase B
VGGNRHISDYVKISPQPAEDCGFFFALNRRKTDMQNILNKRLLNRSKIYTTGRHHLTDLIGNTPLIELKNIGREVKPVKIFAKAEWYNPGGSIKDRAAYNMITNAITNGSLNYDKTILDATSGNTGIAYAMIGASLGYRVTLCLPKNAGDIQKQTLLSYGAELVYTDPLEGTDGAIREAKKMIQAEPEKYFYVDQYNNEYNWQAHYNGTGPEIIMQTQGSITHFVAALGSSGTFIGTGRRLKKYNPDIQIISVQPDSPLHGMEGMKHMATAIVPGIYDPNLADRHMEISTEKAQAMVKRLGREEGLLVGNSAGGAMAIALQIADSLSRGVVVVIFPDAAYRYMGNSFPGDQTQ